MVWFFLTLGICAVLIAVGDCLVWLSLERRYLEIEDRKLWGLDDMEAEVKKIEGRYLALDARLKKLEQRESA